MILNKFNDVNELRESTETDDKLFHNLLVNATLSIGAKVDQDRNVVKIGYTLQDENEPTVFNSYSFEMSLEDFHAFLDKCIDKNIYPLINASRYGLMAMDGLFQQEPELQTFVSFNHRQKDRDIEADNIIHFINLDGVANMTHKWHGLPSRKLMTSYKFTHKNGASFTIASKRTEDFVRGTYTNTNKANYLALATDKVRAYHEFENEHFFERFQIEELLYGIFSLYMPGLKKFSNQLILRQFLLNARDPRA